MNKQFIASLCILAVVGVGVGVGVKGADEAGVGATVTPKLVSVTVNETLVAYGVVPLSTVDAIPSPDLVITPTNDGTVPIKLDIKGADSTNWTLSSTAIDENQFMHKFGLWNGSLGTLIALDPGAYAVLDTSVEADTDGEDFKLRISTPNSTTLYTEESTTVTILATEI